MTEQQIFNFKNEAEKYCVPKSSLENTVTNSDNPVKGKGIIAYISNQLDTATTTLKTYVADNFLSKQDANNDFLKINDASNTYLTKTNAQETYLSEDEADTKYSAIDHTHENNLNVFGYPEETNSSVDNLIRAGYYHYTGNNVATFICDPDIVHYNNGLIQVERNGNQIIQYVNSTSWNNDSYQLDGRRFRRFGNIINDVPQWNKWYVNHIPWNERNDLLKTPGTNINEGSFTIYECTSGYIFKWKQPGENQEYTLPVEQYNYTTIYDFEELPIASPYVFSNLIGHIDIKINTDSIQVRSTAKKNEHIVGVNANYFVPRTN